MAARWLLVTRPQSLMPSILARIAVRTVAVRPRMPSAWPGPDGAGQRAQRKPQDARPLGRVSRARAGARLSGPLRPSVERRYQSFSGAANNSSACDGERGFPGDWHRRLVRSSWRRPVRRHRALCAGVSAGQKGGRPQKRRQRACARDGVYGLAFHLRFLLFF